MDNTTYEYFIRRCWKCSRFKRGADADIWNRLLTDYWEAQNPTDSHVKNPQVKYLKKLSEVKINLDKAFHKLISIAEKKKINQNAIADLQNYKIVVNNSEMPQEIFDILKSSFTIINDNNICPFPNN